MDWLQVITIIFSLAGVLYWFRMDLKSDISRLDGDLKSLGNRLDTDIKAVGTKMDADTRAQNSRTDKLYEMFVQLQRDNNEMIQTLMRKPKTDP